MIYLAIFLILFIFFLIVKSNDRTVMNYDTDDSTPDARKRNWGGTDDDNWLMCWRIYIKLLARNE